MLGTSEALEPGVVAVLGERKGINNSAAREGEALLMFEPGKFLGWSEVKGMGGALQEPGIEEAGDLMSCYGPVGDPARRRLDFDEGFQPEHAACPVANEFDGNTALGSFPMDCVGHFFGPCGEGGGVPGDKDTDTGTAVDRGEG